MDSPQERFNKQMMSVIENAISCGPRYHPERIQQLTKAHPQIEQVIKSLWGIVSSIKQREIDRVDEYRTQLTTRLQRIMQEEGYSSAKDALQHLCDSENPQFHELMDLAYNIRDLMREKMKDVWSTWSTGSWAVVSIDEVAGPFTTKEAVRKYIAETPIAALWGSLRWQVGVLPTILHM